MKNYAFYELCIRIKCNGHKLNSMLKAAGTVNQLRSLRDVSLFA